MSCLFGYVCDMHVEQQSVVLNGHVNEVSFCKHHTNVHWTFGGRSFACKRIKHMGGPHWTAFQACMVRCWQKRGLLMVIAVWRANLGPRLSVSLYRDWVFITNIPNLHQASLSAKPAASSNNEHGFVHQMAVLYHVAMTLCSSAVVYVK